MTVARNTVGKILTLSCSLGLPAVGLALPPDEAPEIELFISGSSAQDGSLENLMRLDAGGNGTPNICQPGTLDIYRGTIDGSRKRVYYCLTSDRLKGVPSGKRLAVHKSSGGSGEGVDPVASAQPIRFIDLNKLPDNDACRQPSRVLFTGNLAAYSNRRDCGGTGILAVPQVGISDIEPELLGRNADGLALHAQSQLVWGLPVSKNFRNALQAIQGLVAADVAHDAAERESEDAMPTLTRAQVASIFAGSLDSFGQMYDAEGAPVYLSSSLAAAAPTRPDLSGTSPGAYRPNAETGNKIYLCRRIASSGTQAAYEIHYLRERCVADAPAFVLPDDGSTLTDGGDVEQLVRRPFPAGRVFAGVGTSDVRACLDAHDEHNRWAIGIFSTENIGNNASSEFRHVKIDGFAPSLVNAHLGLWSHVSEPTLQWRASDDEDFRDTEAGWAMMFIKSHIAQPEVLSSLNSEFEHDWGQGGYLAMPDLAGTRPPVTAELLRKRPVSSTQKADGEGLRNCNVSLIRSRTSAAGF
ncbi:MAG: hypothetical protein AAGF72_18045 [Pseudomonadota bacterium]